MFSFLGLGKSRTKFGRWLDKKEITQIEIEELSGLSRRTVSRLCNDEDYQPKYSTVSRVRYALKKLGESVTDDYFGM
ncbi:transcriptional regulator with XRE-family HTH domain [Cytobacillus purgationiresistens]|uniref:Transcriptional regulator with XRE-family HTH domain n=1 Tax=Cytobacillus purgationiresistens TaxID=863449 RepID=A0ABU0AHG5_9BACI|nr:helix-turn-helix transcriptional regulator [Cytobacillus purgationiresistens]MDQ0270706.1 transcriptional regulator with XRE-family HTH domain [Cytobacillus purgationiresistens]